MNKSFSLSILVAGLAVASSAQAQNGGVSLTDGPARYRVPTGGVANIPTTNATATADFQVQTVGDANQTADHLFSNWWWYRVNNGPTPSTRELAVRETGAGAVRTLLGTNGVQYAFTPVDGLAMTTSFTMVSIDANTAEVRCVLTILNQITATPSVDVSIFNIADYFVANQDANDFASASVVGSNQVITVTDTLRPWATLTHTGFGASAIQTAGFSAIGALMTNTVVDNLNNTVLNPSGATGADIAGLMQWNLNIGSGQSQTLTSIIRVTIPTPGTAALAGLGGLAMFRRRR